jgi:hypothetical protein
VKTGCQSHFRFRSYGGKTLPVCYIILNKIRLFEWKTNPMVGDDTSDFVTPIRRSKQNLEPSTPKSDLVNPTPANRGLSPVSPTPLPPRTPYRSRVFDTLLICCSVDHQFSWTWNQPSQIISEASHHDPYSRGQDN